MAASPRRSPPPRDDNDGGQEFMAVSPPRSRSPSPAPSPLRRPISEPELWDIVNRINPALERYQAIIIAIANLKHQDMSDEELFLEMLVTMPTERWGTILEYQKYDRRTKIRKMLEYKLDNEKKGVRTNYNDLFRIQNLDQLFRSLSEEEQLIDDLSKQLRSAVSSQPDFSDYTTRYATYLNWRETIRNIDPMYNERKEELRIKTRTEKGLDSAFKELQTHALRFEEKLDQLESKPVSEDVKADWEFFYSDLQAIHRDMRALLEYRALFFKTEYVPSPPYERISPWRESELEDSIAKNEEALQGRKDDLAEFDRKAPLSLEEMREKYVRGADQRRRMGRGYAKEDFLYSRASEKSVRAHHANMMAKKRETLVQYVKWNTEEGAKLRAELERIRQKKRTALPALLSPRRSRSPSIEEDDDDSSPLRLFKSGSKKSAPRSRSPSPAPSPLRRSESSDESSLLRLFGGKSTTTTTTKKRAVSPPRPKPKPREIIILSDDDEPVVVIQKPPPPPPEEEDEEERPRKKTSGATRVMSILAKQEGIVARMMKHFNMGEDEAVLLAKQLETWLVNEWFSKKKRAPSVATVIDKFFVENQGELVTSKNERRWKRFLKPLDEPANKFLKAPLLEVVGCALCSTPAPRYHCGAGCKTGVRYCGQDCADAHWAEHNCRN
jgi:hypothetical protein